MRLEPIQNWIIGRVAICRISKEIIILGKTQGTTRFVYIEQASPEAQAAGFIPGMFVVPSKVYDMLFNDKKRPHVITMDYHDILCKVHDLVIDDLIDPMSKETFKMNPDEAPNKEAAA